MIKDYKTNIEIAVRILRVLKQKKIEYCLTYYDENTVHFKVINLTEKHFLILKNIDGIEEVRDK